MRTSRRQWMKQTIATAALSPALASAANPKKNGYDVDEVERRLHRLKERNSILDAVLEDMQRFQQGLGADDRERLDQYFTSVRELEERLHIAGEWEQRPKAVTEAGPPSDIADMALPVIVSFPRL